MATEVQHDDGRLGPSRLLLDATRRLAPGWLERTTITAAARGGVEIDADDPELAAVVDDAVTKLLAALTALVATDVDEQRTNPLSLFRQAVAEPNALLLRRGALPTTTDRFAVEHFPDDVFGLGPAAWSDIDPELHEPGITWGAWKAMIVLRRRRDEGLR